MKKILFIIIFLLIQTVSALNNCTLYDDFSSGNLDNTKWEIRQDIEGQPFMDEYRVITKNNNSFFHTKQNEIVDKRVALVPTYNFTAGETLSYTVKYISGSGNNGHILLLTTTEFPNGDYIRAGLIGYNNGQDVINETGKYHIKIKILDNRLDLKIIAPSGKVINNSAVLSNPNAKYKLYVESWTGHNGLTHIDYDNFKICKRV